MRVISGKAKSKKLKAPPQIRPLTDRAKEALFNILRNQVEGSFFLDLCAGSGAVGIEALSRGAKKAIFIEKASASVAMLKANLATTGLADLAEVHKNDAARALNLLQSRELKFDLIFVGAPYDDPILEEVLNQLSQTNIMAESAIIIAEHRKQHQLPAGVREAKYGETVFTFYEKGNLSGQF